MNYLTPCHAFHFVFYVVVLIFNASLSSCVVLIFLSMLGRLNAFFKTQSLNGSERSMESKLLLSQGVK